MRSLLFVPGDSERKLQLASASAADALIVDLEDSVADVRKPAARQLASDWLKTWPPQARKSYVRINPLPSAHAAADLDAIVHTTLDGIVLPKSEPEQLRALDQELRALEAARGVNVGAIKIIAITMETPQSVFGMGGYQGASTRLQALTWGAEDLAAALGTINRGPDGYEDVFKLTRAWCLLAAGAAQVDAIDTVYPDFKDPTGLRTECIASRRAGFVGKLAIHPNQLEIINEVFAPTAAELDWARRVVAAFAENPELGAVGIEGKMVDRPHWLAAKRLLSRL